MQLLKKSPSKREKSDDDSTPISQLVKESKTTPKKKLFTESNKMVAETIVGDTSLKRSKKLKDDDTSNNEVKKIKNKQDKTEEMATITDLMNQSKKKTKKDEKTTTTTKNIRKQKCYKKKKNRDNLDLEEDEADIIWEIHRDWTLTYYRRNNVMKTKRQILKVMALENYRKEVAKEGELLIHWEDGRREWAFCCNVKIDAKAAMYNAAIKRFKLTNEIMEFGLSKAILIPTEEKENELDKLVSVHDDIGMYLITNCKPTNAFLTLLQIILQIVSLLYRSDRNGRSKHFNQNECVAYINY
jgi:hypothetical protein